MRSRLEMMQANTAPAVRPLLFIAAGSHCGTAKAWQTPTVFKYCSLTMRTALQQASVNMIGFNARQICRYFTDRF